MFIPTMVFFSRDSNKDPTSPTVFYFATTKGVQLTVDLFFGLIFFVIYTFQILAPGICFIPTNFHDIKIQDILLFAYYLGFSITTAYIAISK